ncbi:MAG TPA: hypothetical protein VJS44_19290 [Pyrinomonadaceae bacterium]|nr:hypothetical protein [Pyrinomonadaceae bacterium]
MKRCPRCSRTYTDDTLSYCLDDGTRLIGGYDADATQVNPFPPASPTAPTVAYQAPTLPSPGPPPPATQPAFNEPAPRRKSHLLTIVAVFVALVIGVGIGGLMFQRYTTTSPAVVASASPTPSAAATAATATPRPTSSPTPAPATPTPSPMATPSRSVVQSTPEPKTGCVLHNDVADRSGVRVRVDCDTRDCDNDSSTISGEYPDDTPVRVVKGANVRGARFTWVKVVVIDSGETVWVASTKIKCS